MNGEQTTPVWSGGPVEKRNLEINKAVYEDDENETENSTDSFELES